MRKLSDMPQNQFTPKIYDLVIPKVDPSSKEKIPCLFLVMEYMDTDLKKVLNDADKI